ncbi:glycosyltransferase family 2 protein [Clostridium polynesiense]|uniref:glycosyltransferase family 2 protein n=1 Tax=Clostridium polynesiense TaxID=1325933 RepID=UPI00058FD1F3|nr:glycosyltransferase family 2 protein [Clostridium polynesiense]
MDISIIIVSYNTKQLTLDAIESVFKTTKNVSYEIFVVDNASKDGSVEAIKKSYGDKVKLIENKENLGFSAANNMAIKKSQGRYILLLNSDTIVKNDTIAKTIAYMDDNTEAGVLGCKVLLRDGKLDKACKRGFPTPWNSFSYLLKLDKIFPGDKRFGGYHLTYINENETAEVDCVMGAYMLLRKEIIESVGLLDETFFMYGEDVDWCYRIKEAGWKIIYYPEAEIIHYKKASSAKKGTKTIIEFYRAMYIFYNKHFKEKYNIFISFLIYLGIVVQLLLALTKNLFKSKKSFQL